MDTHSEPGANASSLLKIAWLIPSAVAGAHWQPLWTGFLAEYPNTRFYTTRVWQEFDPNSVYGKATYQLGEMESVLARKTGDGYRHGYLKLPLNVIFYLIKFKPDVIVANAFSIWTLIAIFFKFWFNWKVIILYEGSTPSSDFKNSSIRTLTRKFIVNNANSLIANTSSSKKYLIEHLGAQEGNIVSGPYLLPDKTYMNVQDNQLLYSFLDSLKRPIFLFVGQIIKRKGVFELVQACGYLNNSKKEDFSLIIVGEGSEKDCLQQEIINLGMTEQILLTGRVDYGKLGYYFNLADAFIFPTFEDTWGMVALEAMAHGKPVLCSKYAGSSELVIDQENGYIIDPLQPTEIAEKMGYLFDKELAAKMGHRSLDIMNGYTLAGSISVFKDAILLALSDTCYSQ